MPLLHATGDLFRLGLPAIGHGCNCRGSMAGGIARDFRERWPEMHAAYRQRCIAGAFRPGDVMVWPTADVVLYNLATQDKPGSDARLEHVAASVRAALDDARERGLGTLGLPRLGSGIGGLAAADVEAVLEEAAADSPVELVLVTRPPRTVQLP